MKLRLPLIAAAVAVALLAGLPVVAQNGQTPRVGEVFPAFSGTTWDGRQINLADYRGKVVLIDFWATWCGPCIAEMPHVKRAHNQYNSQGFEVIGISLDSDANALKNWYSNRRTSVPWPSIFDGRGWQSELGQRFGIRAIPATFLLDRQGRVVATDLRGDSLVQRVGELVAR